MIDWDSAVLAPVESVFGEPVEYLPAFGAAFQTTGIFDAAYREIDSTSGVGVTSVMPVLGVRLSWFPVPPVQGDQLTILRTGVSYRVKEVRPDSHGAAKLMLNRVA